jgi:phosphate-selective porin OprO/OprP
VFRLGQFKVPFGLEQSSLDRNIFFAERSMGYYLTPRRDVGLMAHACLWDGRLYYGVGLFNGDGLDDASGGDEDSPALAGRLAWEPFAAQGPDWARNLHLGASFYYADIDRNNVGATVRTTGLTPLLSLSSNAKFAVVQDADNLIRSGLELGWAGGPLVFMAEYTTMKFKNVTTSAHRFDLSMKNYYLAGMWMLTGEKPGFSRGALRAITPRRSLWDGGWGALGLAMRYDHFQADEAVYDYMVEPGDSVRRADAYTVALSWFLDPTARLILDYTHTEFDRPLLVGHDSFKGTSIFSDYEDVITARFQFGF